MDVSDSDRSKRSRESATKRSINANEGDLRRSASGLTSSVPQSTDMQFGRENDSYLRERDGRKRQEEQNRDEYEGGRWKRRKEEDEGKPLHKLPFAGSQGYNSSVSATSGFVDFVTPQRTRLLDNAAYESVVEQQLAELQSRSEEEAQVERIREKTRALLARTTTAASPSTPSLSLPAENLLRNHASVSASSTSNLVVRELPTSKSTSSTLLLGLKPVDPDDDMFGDSFVDSVAVKQEQHPSSSHSAHSTHPHSKDPVGGQGAAADDDEGYYTFRIGEVLGNGKYEVLGYYGKGVYSNVIRARRLFGGSVGGSMVNGAGVASVSDENVFAIKLLRNNAHMKRSGKKEVKVLKMLQESDPEGKCHCMRMMESFEEKGHLCLVFESLDMNLTEVVKLYGHHVGLSIDAVRNYAFKMFKALALMKRCNLIHSDIKPDNVLVSKDRKEVKLADFGTALESQEMELTNQLVSRYYRAPEIIVGLFPYSFPIDVFSIGCCLYEIATGRYLLPSENDNHHLKLCMDIGGPFPKKLLSQCHPPFLLQHFAPLSSNDSSSDYLFLERFPDPLDPSRALVRKLDMPQRPQRSLLQELLTSYQAPSLSQKEISWVHRLADLITQCLSLDPKKRITPEAALQHDLF